MHDCRTQHSISLFRDKGVCDSGVGLRGCGMGWAHMGVRRDTKVGENN